MTESGPYRNFLEVRVFGLQRSGNHAIIRWIIDQHAGQPTCFLNDVRHGDFDPFSSTPMREVWAIEAPEDIESLRAVQKRVLIYSYEDSLSKLANGQRLLLDSRTDPGFLRNREHYLGKSRHHRDVMILRDPFNFFASRLKKLNELTGVRDLEWIVENWKALAHKAVYEAEPEPTPVKYNDWRIDEGYRRNLSSYLLGDFSDACLNTVSTVGGGSSFDTDEDIPLKISDIREGWRKLLEIKRYADLGYYLKRLRAKGPESLNVLERWRQMESNKDFRRIFADEEILHLSEQLFGEIPGTRDFVRACTR